MAIPEIFLMFFPCKNLFSGLGLGLVFWQLSLFITNVSVLRTLVTALIVKPIEVMTGIIVNTGLYACRHSWGERKNRSWPLAKYLFCFILVLLVVLVFYANSIKQKQKINNHILNGWLSSLYLFLLKSWEHLSNWKEIGSHFCLCCVGKTIVGGSSSSVAVIVTC